MRSNFAAKDFTRPAWGIAGTEGKKFCFVSRFEKSLILSTNPSAFVGDPDGWFEETSKILVNRSLIRGNGSLSNGDISREEPERMMGKTIERVEIFLSPREAIVNRETPQTEGSGHKMAADGAVGNRKKDELSDPSKR